MYNVMTHPAILFGCANVALSMATGNAPGAIANAALTSINIGMAVRAGVKNQPLDNPFYLLGAVNLFSGVSGFAGLDLSETQNLKEAATKVAANLSFIGWGVGCFFSGLQEKRQRQGQLNDGAIPYDAVSYGVGNISLTMTNVARGGNIFPLVLSVLGFSRATIFRPRSHPQYEQSGQPRSNGWRHKLSHHMTPSRFYAAGFLANAVLAFKIHPLFTVSNLFASAAYMTFDSDKNKELLESIKQCLGKRKGPQHALAKTSAKPFQGLK